MLLGFKRQFAPFVEEGSKTHTIRAPRVIRPKVGETAHCYVDPRQKTMRLLGRWPCVRVQRIVIIENREPTIPLMVMIDGAVLSPSEANDFLYRDGFREDGGEQYPALRQAFGFWRKRLAENNGQWIGVLIHWQFEAAR